MTRCRLLRPNPGEKFRGVLLGGLSEFKMHWFNNRLYPCTRCERCPYCPGRPDKISFRWYGPAAEFTSESWDPSEQDHAIYKLRLKAGEKAEPPRSKYIHTIAGIALAEIPDAEMIGLGDTERRAMVLQWSKGSFKNSPIKVEVIGTWQSSVLMEEFDWLPYAERILNNGQPIRIQEIEEEENPDILKSPFRRQA